MSTTTTNSSTNANYGFDFLLSEHQDSSSSTKLPETTISAKIAVIKTSLEKQFDVLNFLQTQRLFNDDININNNNNSNGMAMYSELDILEHTGIDLREDMDVVDMLHANPRIRIIPHEDYINSNDHNNYNDCRNNPDIMNMYAYESKFQISNKLELLALVNRCKNGICAKDLRDAYGNVDMDLQDLICSGEVIAVANSEVRDKTLFPRGEVFLVDLDGSLLNKSQQLQQKKEKEKDKKNANTVENSNVDSSSMIRSNSNDIGTATTTAILQQSPQLFQIHTDKDSTKELRRGEAVWIGGQWFRVSSAVRDGVPLSDQPPRAQAPLSVSSIHDMSKKNEIEGYCRQFTKSILPVDRAMSKETIQNLSNAKKAKEKLDQLGGPPPHMSSRLASSTAVVRKRPTTSNSASTSANISARTAAAANPDLMFMKARRHGCSKDIREMYLGTRSDVPESEVDLYRLLVGNKLVEEGEAMRRPSIRNRSDNLVNGKAKKKRYYVRKGHKITNTHLAGTEIGAVLAMASERQQQGKDVGDGGM